MVEVGGIVIFCHFWQNEALRAVGEGGGFVIFCHFWQNEALRAVGEGGEID